MIDVAGHHKAVKQHRRSINRGLRNEDSGEHADILGTEAEAAAAGAMAATGDNRGTSPKQLRLCRRSPSRR
jgi:hypothetical protein